MSILYGKVRIYSTPNQTIDVTDSHGNTKQFLITGETYSDIILPGMEEYTIDNREDSKTVLLNTKGFLEISLPEPKPLYYHELKAGTTLTEAQWLDFLNDDGVNYIIDKHEQASFIGKTFRLENSVNSSNKTWRIADFGHDNSGYTVDCVQQNSLYTCNFSSSSWISYSGSIPRSWLINTYYNGFSDEVKNKFKSIASNGDKLILPSVTELGKSDDYAYVEGTVYPLFKTSTLGYVKAWTRTMYKGGYDFIWYWNQSSVTYSGYNSSYGVIPLIRF